MKVREGATLSGVRALVFDAYGTLFDVHAVAMQLGRIFGAHTSEVSALWRQKQLEYTWLRALMGAYRDFEGITEDALAYAVESLGLTLDDVDRERLMAAYRTLESYPEVPEALPRLSGWRLAILSNGTPRMLAAATHHAGIASYLEVLLSADAVRSYKTDSRVYRLATDHFGMAAQEILFCSSNAWDIAGAGTFGFRTCWLNRGGALQERLGVEADIVAGDLMALADLLAELSPVALDDEAHS